MLKDDVHLPLAADPEPAAKYAIEQERHYLQGPSHATDKARAVASLVAALPVGVFGRTPSTSLFKRRPLPLGREFFPGLSRVRSCTSTVPARR